MPKPIRLDVALRNIAAGHDVIGPRARVIRGLAPIAHAYGRDLISFYSGPQRGAAALIRRTGASIIVCKEQVARSVGQTALAGKTLVVVANPRLAYIRIAAALFAGQKVTGIHPTAVVHPNAKLGTDVFIGPNATIGACQIGSGCAIHGNTFIASGCRIGKNVTVYPGAVIGADGFGYERNEAGHLERFPHFGSVVIEDDVEIGANACIDRGALEDTIVRRGTKIDDLVYIAHNVEIGPDALIIAQAAVCGSARIEEGAWIAPGVVVREGARIGARAIVGLGAVVIRDVPAGITVAGVPARRLRHKKRRRRDVGRHRLALSNT